MKFSFVKGIVLWACVAVLVAYVVLTFSQDLLAQSKNRLTTIILVRHAEKDTMRTDPPLTEAGWKRARALARLLEDSKVRSTHSTQFRRTTETMLPLDSLFGITNEVFPVDRDSIEQHAQTLVKHFLAEHNGETIVAASHSNVLPLIIKALGVGEEIKIDESDYTNVFIVTVSQDLRSTMVRLRVE